MVVLLQWQHSWAVDYPRLHRGWPSCMNSGVAEHVWPTHVAADNVVVYHVAGMHVAVDQVAAVAYIIWWPASERLDGGSCSSCK